jgi:hypothetical protein
MFIESLQRFADVVCTRDAPRWRAKSWDIYDSSSSSSSSSSSNNISMKNQSYH